MDKQETLYCKTCSLKILGNWKGRPHKDTLPLLPKLANGSCQRCGGATSLRSGDIAWRNDHDENSAELFAHWVLVEAAHENKCGLPYFSEMPCPKCQQRSIVSELNVPDGTTEYKCNCQLCGVVDIG